MNKSKSTKVNKRNESGPQTTTAFSINDEIQNRSVDEMIDSIPDQM